MERARFDTKLCFCASPREARLIDGRAADAGMTRSEYLRALCAALACASDETASEMLDAAPDPRAGRRDSLDARSLRIAVKLPAESAERLRDMSDETGLSVSSILRRVATGGARVRLRGAGRGDVTDGERAAAACVTDEAVWELSAQINRAGVNYNQSVRALNTIAAWVRRADDIGEDERGLFWETLRSITRLNEDVADELRSARASAERISEKTGFPLRTDLIRRRDGKGGR